MSDRPTSQCNVISLCAMVDDYPILHRSSPIFPQTPPRQLGLMHAHHFRWEYPGEFPPRRTYPGSPQEQSDASIGHCRLVNMYI